MIRYFCPITPQSLTLLWETFETLAPLFSKSCPCLWFLRTFADLRILYKSPVASELFGQKRSIHQGKKEVACIGSKPLVSCLWGCGESLNPPKLNIQEALSSRPKGDPGPLPIFQDFFTFVKWQPWFKPISLLARSQKSPIVFNTV